MVLGGSWWILAILGSFGLFLMVLCGSLWFLVVFVDFGGSWWFLVVLGGSW